MTPQFFTEKMSRHLTSLAPGFEGHYGYYRTVNSYDTLNGRTIVVCRPEYHLAETIGRTYGEFVCPAWQAEDVLRNIEELLKKCGKYMDSFSSMEYAEQILGMLICAPDFNTEPDTAYQKIEEYLWTMLK